MPSFSAPRRPKRSCATRRGGVRECAHDRCRCGAQPREGLHTEGWPWLKSPFQPTQRNGARGWFWRGSAQRASRDTSAQVPPGPGSMSTARPSGCSPKGSWPTGSEALGDPHVVAADQVEHVGEDAPVHARPGLARDRHPAPAARDPHEPADLAGRAVVHALAADVEGVERLRGHAVAARAAPGAVRNHIAQVDGVVAATPVGEIRARAADQLIGAVAALEAVVAVAARGSVPGSEAWTLTESSRSPASTSMRARAGVPRGAAHSVLPSAALAHPGPAASGAPKSVTRSEPPPLMAS